MDLKWFWKWVGITNPKPGAETVGASRFFLGSLKNTPIFQGVSKNPANGEFTQERQLGVHPLLDGDGQGESGEFWVDFLQNCP